MVARFQAGERAGLPAQPQGRRHRPQPHPRRPRRPRRPLVEPRGRGAGHRPRLPDRPDQAGPGAPDGHAGHARGADRGSCSSASARSRTPYSPAAKPPSPSSATRSCATWSPCARKRAARPTSPISSRRGERDCAAGEGQPGRVTHGRLVAPRTGIRSWWGKAWQRAVEEAAYVEADLRGGRTLARRGEVGGISVAAGSLLAAVREGDDAWTAEIEVPVLAAEERQALVDVVAAEAGRVARAARRRAALRPRRACRGGRRRAAARTAVSSPRPAPATPTSTRAGTRWRC